MPALHRCRSLYQPTTETPGNRPPVGLNKRSAVQAWQRRRTRFKNAGTASLSLFVPAYAETPNNRSPVGLNKQSAVQAWQRRRTRFKNASTASLLLFVPAYAETPNNRSPVGLNKRSAVQANRSENALDSKMPAPHRCCSLYQPTLKPLVTGLP